MNTTKAAGNGMEQVRPTLNGANVKTETGQAKPAEQPTETGKTIPMHPTRSRTVEDIANLASRIQQMMDKLRQLRETMERINTMSAAQNPGQDTLRLTVGGENFTTSHPVLIDMVLNNANTYLNSEIPKLEAELLATI
jgi:hypothetical protein